MLNRRHIRAKVMQLLYSEKDNLNHKILFKKLTKTMHEMYDLYLLMISFLIRLRLRAINYQKKSSKKHIKTENDVNPNMRFIENKFLIKLCNDKSIRNKIKNSVYNWGNNMDYVDLILKDIFSSDIYKLYMQSPYISFQEDTNFIIEIFKKIIVPNSKLYDYIQDKNISWSDDFPVVNTFIVKLFSKIPSNKKSNLFTTKLFKDSKDERFGFDLIESTIKNSDKYDDEIVSMTKNWDKDRIAKIDLIILKMAICEFQEFIDIPAKVTINEYIELAKDYSTPKSNVFINGILDKILKKYIDNKTLNKKGRGLM